MSDRLTLAIDPGRTGATALLDGRGTLRALVGWRLASVRGRSRYRVDGWSRGREGGEVSTVKAPLRSGALGNMVAALLPLVDWRRVDLVAEDVYVGRNAGTAITAARMLGGLLSPFEERVGHEAVLVKASEWRADLLGLKRTTKREDAKAASLERIPPMIEGLPEALLALGTLDHYTDAAGIAAWRRRETCRRRASGART